MWKLSEHKWIKGREKMFLFEMKTFCLETEWCIFFPPSLLELFSEACRNHIYTNSIGTFAYL
jgi:hypothetical protein